MLLEAELKVINLKNNMENKEIVKELQALNKTVKELFLFLLCRESYSKSQIREIFGKVDNNKITKIRSGLEKINKNK